MNGRCRGQTISIRQSGSPASEFRFGGIGNDSIHLKNRNGRDTSLALARLTGFAYSDKTEGAAALLYCGLMIGGSILGGWMEKGEADLRPAYLITLPLPLLGYWIGHRVGLRRSYRIKTSGRGLPDPLKNKPYPLFNQP